MSIKLKSMRSQSKKNIFTHINFPDFLRIKNQIIPSNSELENRIEYDRKLKRISSMKSMNWPDSIETKKKKELDLKRKEFLEEELRKRKIDEEERKYQEIKNNLIIESARNKLFLNQDPVKSFKSKLLFCDVLKERDYQKMIEEKKKEMNKVIEKNYNELVKKK